MTANTLRGCVLTALLVAACAPAMATQISVDPRVEEEVGRGRSRVLVELRMSGAVRPEAAPTSGSPAGSRARHSSRSRSARPRSPR
jgi:hypothetical protein